MGRTRLLEDEGKMILLIMEPWVAESRVEDEKMGSIRVRNGMDLTEADDIKKRWQEYTEELYKRDLHDPDNHDGMITHLGMWIQVDLRKHHYEQS